MQKNRKYLTTAVVLLIITLVTTATFTYAYFTSIVTGEFNNINISSPETGNAYASSGNDIDLLVSGEDMDILYADSTKPAVTGNTTTPATIVLYTTASGGTLTCLYDVYYSPEEPFYNSSANVSDKKEFTLRGWTNDNSAIIEETNLSGITEDLLLLENEKISLTGVNKERTLEWYFEAAFYNQPFSQDDNVDISFGGKILINNLRCENTFAETY